MVDGTVHACARLGIYRPELKNLFPRRPEAIFSGFEYLFDLTSLPAERSSVVLGAVAHGLDGSCFPISIFPFHWPLRRFLMNITTGEHHAFAKGQSASSRETAELVRSRSDCWRLRITWDTEADSYTCTNFYAGSLVRTTLPLRWWLPLTGRYAPQSRTWESRSM